MSRRNKNQEQSSVMGSVQMSKSVNEKRYGYLISTQKHPITVSYKTEGMVIPPRGRVPSEGATSEMLIDKLQLGALPKGVAFRPIL